MTLHQRDELDDLLDEGAAAHALGLRSHRTLAAWRRLGSGPAFVKLGRFVRYRRADLATFVAERTVNPPRHPLAVRVTGEA